MLNQKHKIAQVLVLYPFDKTFDYIIPKDMKLKIGNIVKVPFGKQSTIGIVWKFGKSEVNITKLKEIKEKLDYPPLKKELLDFIQWVSDYNLIPLGNVLKMTTGVIKNFKKPKKKNSQITQNINVKNFNLFKLSKEQQKVFEFINTKINEQKHSTTILEGTTGSGKTEVYFHVIKEILNNPIPPSPRGEGNAKHFRGVLQQRIPYKKDLKQKAQELRQNITPAEKELWHKLLYNKKTGYKFVRQKPLLNYIVDFYCHKLRLIIEIDGVSHCDQVKYDKIRTKRLEELGLKFIRYSNPQIYKNIEGVYEDLKKQIEKRINEIKPPWSLLDSYPPLKGGSMPLSTPFTKKERNTKHFRRKPQILILLPEIALTTQLIDRFEKQFGFKPAIWHSQITPAKKRDMWNGIVNNTIQVAIGARSALFLPFNNLSLIIVDEEHDQSFKQTDNGSYSARDMAIVRAKINNIPIVLSSATPSLETLINAEKNKYHKIHLPNRFGKAVMPEIKIINLKKENLKRNKYVSKELLLKITQHLENKKQALLFLNRRGYAPIVLCKECGYKISCPHCSCTLTKHKSKQKLICHYCTYKLSQSKICPECKVKESLIDFGPGVEKIEEEIKKHFPKTNTAIITSDTINNTKKAEEIFNKIINKEIDIIIGTQLIAKGHHFPNLTLVGILDADASLFGGDIRASERTYQLLTQVSGRAGREEDKGLVIIQSYTPENLVLQSIKNGNKDILIDFEKQNRKILNFPPYGKLALIQLSGKNELKVIETIKKIVKKIPYHREIEILGPSPAAISRIKREFRYKIFIKTTRKINIQKLIKESLNKISIPSNIRIKIDIDPI